MYPYSLGQDATGDPYQFVGPLPPIDPYTFVGPTDPNQFVGPEQSGSTDWLGRIFGIASKYIPVGGSSATATTGAVAGISLGTIALIGGAIFLFANVGKRR